MSTQFEQAALPFAAGVIASLKTALNGLSNDPVVAAAQFVPAVDIVINQIVMQFPVLAASEFGAAKAALNSKLDDLSAKIAAAQAAH